jgi:hypothetical protein
MALPYKTIARIKRTLNETLEVAEKSQIILFHLNIATRRSSIWADREWTDPEETAKTIWEAAKEHAQAMGGPQRFQVNTYDLDDDSTDHPVRTCVFNVDQGFTNDSEALSSETPDQTGLTVHLMRHNQELFRQHTAAVGALTHMLARTVEKQADQIDRLMADRMQTIVVMEDLMSRKHERELATRKAEQDMLNKKEMMEKIMSLAPVVVNKIAGKEIVRQKTSALEATVMAFMETIKPHHLDAFANSGLLDRQQLILLGTLLEQVTKTMITAEQKKEQLETAGKAARNELESGT